VNSGRTKEKVSGQMANIPLLLLTTTGAKSGSISHQATCLHERWRSHRRDRLVRRRPQNPPWYHNLVANSEATVELGSEHFRVRAAVTSGEERQRLYNRQADQMPIFAEYQQKTTRQIPVIVLTRID